MRTYRVDLLAGLSALLLVATAPLGAQVREVVSSRIAVSSRDATLNLDFTTGESLEVAFREGEVVVDGEPLGSYGRGDPLEDAWRSLLSDAVQLDDGPLARALIDWTPPSTLEGEAATLAGRIDRTLEERLTAPEPAPSQAEPPAPPSPPEQGLASLLRRTDRLEILAESLEGLTLDDVQIRIDENVTVSSGEVIGAALVVVDGDLDVNGTVDGDVVVVDGALRIFEGGRITGEVRLADARIFRNGGEIEGAVRNVQMDRERALEALENLDELESLEALGELEGLEDEIRDRVRSELRDELRSEFRDRSGGSGVFAPLRSVGRGLAGLLQILITFVIVMALGALVAHFFSENLGRVADTARHTPVRAGMVGLAGAFLLLPAWVLGMVALAVSIIGIPVLLAWIPLFPLAACLAAGLGYLAVARLVGEWITGQDLQGLDFLRPSNTIHALAAGVALLLIPFAAANVVEMAGRWLGFVEGLFLTVGWVAGGVAIAVGFGAVLLTRGGRRPRPRPAPSPFDDPDWPTGSGPTAGPDPTEGPGSTSPPDDEERWESEEAWKKEWEDLEREARERATGAPGPEEDEEGEATEREDSGPEPESGSGGAARGDESAPNEKDGDAGGSAPSGRASDA